MGTKHVKINQLIPWCLTFILGCYFVASSQSMEDRKDFHSKDRGNPSTVREIATKIFKADGNPAPSIVLRVTSASWCLPCKLLKPKLEKLKEQGYVIHIYDLDNDPDAPRPSPGFGVPYLRYERFGEVAEETSGNKEAKQIEETFQRLEGSIFILGKVRK